MPKSARMRLVLATTANIAVESYKRANWEAGRVLTGVGEKFGFVCRHARQGEPHSPGVCLNCETLHCTRQPILSRKEALVMRPPPRKRISSQMGRTVARNTGTCRASRRT